MRKLMEAKTEKDKSLGEHAGLQKPTKGQSIAQRAHRYITHQLRLSLPVVNDYS